MTTYRVTVRTGKGTGAGTDAEIGVTFVGEHAESGPHVLSRAFHDDFEAGDADTYEVEGEDVGQMHCLRVCNQTLLVKDDWLLEEIIVDRDGQVSRFPFFRWVKADTEVYVLEGSARLPQHVRTPKEAAARASCLAQRKTTYVWASGKNPKRPGPPLMPGLLEISEEHPLPVDETYRDISEHNYVVTYVETLGELKFSAPLVALAWNALEKCDELLQFVGMPTVSKRWRDDHEFARQALQGVDPTVIRLASGVPDGMPFTDAEAYGLLEQGVTLADAFAARRIFLLDFGDLDGIPMFRDKTDPTKRRWAPAGRALLFREAGGGLVPIAIQLGRDASALVWTPKDTPNDWMAAKMFLRCAEGNLHQILAHAVRTHFAMEPFIVAALRNYASAHPVYKLMRRHFRYTLAINEGARGTLLDEDGVFDEFISCGGPDKGHLALAVKTWAKWNFRDARLPDDLRARGVDSHEVLAEYPYRDDALPLWKAIGEYVRDTLAAFYPSDADVAGDTETQAFWDDLRTNGVQPDKLPYAKLETREQLADVLHTVMFNVSVQHTTVNNLQFEHYGWVPNAPLGMHGAPPTERGKLTLEHLVAMMPSLAQTQGQIAIGKALSTLGRDEEVLLQKGGWFRPYFQEPAAIGAREKFFAALREQALRVEVANRHRVVPYEILHPDRIPCSITI